MKNLHRMQREQQQQQWENRWKWMAQSKYKKKHPTQHSTTHCLPVSLARARAHTGTLYSFSGKFTFGTTGYCMHFICALSCQSFCPVSYIVWVCVCVSSASKFPRLSIAFSRFNSIWARSLDFQIRHSAFTIFFLFLSQFYRAFSLSPVVLLHSRFSQFAHAFICIREFRRANS